MDQRLVESFWERVQKGEDSSACWNWVGFRKHSKYGRDRFGYGLIFVRRNVFLRAHRFSWELHHGPIAPGMVVCHRCDNPPCANPDHLFLGSAADNMRDMVEKKRHSVGISQPHAKLTDELVAEIRELANSKSMSQRSIAKRYGVSEALVSQVKTGKKWKHVPSLRPGGGPEK